MAFDISASEGVMGMTGRTRIDRPGPYRFSFTRGGLFLYESMALAEAWVKTGDWKVARGIVPSNVFVSTGKAKTVLEYQNQVISRLKSLTDEELQFLAVASLPDVKALCWLSACRAHRPIMDYAREELREHYGRYAEPVSEAGFFSFLNGIEIRADLKKDLTDNTRTQLKVTLFRMMREADLIDRDNTVLSIPISPELRDMLRNRPIGGLDCLPGEM